MSCTVTRSCFYDYGARLYNPATGRWLSADGFLTDGLNRYAYVSNNPLRYTDPTGHEEEPKKKKIQIVVKEKREDAPGPIKVGSLGVVNVSGKDGNQIEPDAAGARALGYLAEHVTDSGNVSIRLPNQRICPCTWSDNNFTTAEFLTSARVYRFFGGGPARKWYEGPYSLGLEPFPLEIPSAIPSLRNPAGLGSLAIGSEEAIKDLARSSANLTPTVRVPGDLWSSELNYWINDMIRRRGYDLYLTHAGEFTKVEALQYFGAGYIVEPTFVPGLVVLRAPR